MLSLNDVSLGACVLSLKSELFFCSDKTSETITELILLLKKTFSLTEVPN